MDELHVHLKAWREFHKAVSWYASKDKRVALRFMGAVWAAIQEILATPSAWPLTDGRHRYRIVNGFPYRVIYRWSPERTYVIAIAHFRRKPDHWKNRK